MSQTATLTPSTRPGRSAGVLTLLAGAAFVVLPLLVELVSYDLFALMGLAGVLVLVALPGLRRLQRGADGRAGAWGLRLLLAGLIVLVVLVASGDPLDAALDGTAQAVAEGAFVVLGITSMLALLVGVISFSVGMTRARVFPPAAIWVFLGGMTLALVSEAFEQSLRGPVPTVADVLPVAGFVVSGLGLLLLGRAALAMGHGWTPHAVS